MSKHLGDFDTSAVIYGKFSTFRPSTGAAYTLAGTPALSVYKDNSTTQSTSGVTLTADFDSVTGLNHFAIDTSSDGAFYAAGSFFDIVITTGTVDSVSVVGSVVASFTIRKTSALKPTTAGRTLDVSAGGEAGVDWANVGTPGSTVALSATTVGTVTTTTTTTNLTNERGKYANGSVWIGPTVNTNTVSYTDGISTNPVSTIAAAKTIADALNLRRFYCVRTGAVSIGATMAGYDFDGANWSLTTTGGSQDVGTSHFVRATLAGGTYASTTGTIHWEDCDFDVAVTVGVSHMLRCVFANTLTLSTAGDYDFVDCASGVGGTATPVFVIPAGTVNVSFRRWSGGIEIQGITSTTVISIDVVSGGTVTLKGADGNVQVRGMVSSIDDQRTGTPTLGQNATLNRTVLATPTNITAGTITTVSGNVNGSVGSVTGAVGSVTGAVGSVTGNVGGNVVGSVGSVTGAVGSVTGNVTGSIGSLATQAKADVNAEVVDALNVDTYAEPGQGAPVATAALTTKVGYLYKAWRNKSDQSASTMQLYADDATTVDQKRTVSDSGTVTTVGEVATGP